MSTPAKNAASVPQHWFWAFKKNPHYFQSSEADLHTGRLQQEKKASRRDLGPGKSKQ